MNVGLIGLGKLGLPTALAIEAKGHSVVGYDPSPAVADAIRTRRMAYREEGAQALLDHSRLEFIPLADVVARAELLLVTIQTPHDERYEGVTPLPAERRDFDYSFLVSGLRDLVAEVDRQQVQRTVVVVSTVLPGTIDREIRPLLSARVGLVYNPFFIAMGTTIQDFLHPEFVLLGADAECDADVVRSFYATLVDAPIRRTSIRDAEVIKTLYNTFISTKIAFANTAMELCHRIGGADVDVVLSTLMLGTRRLISDRYLSAGMGDGGACHPRDNIALSHLSRTLGMSFDWFENVMLQRERQTEWLADLVEQHAAGRPLVILGRSFKAESSLVAGSPAILLRNMLRQRGHAVAMWDPYLDDADALLGGVPLCYFIGTRHQQFATFPFEPGSVVLDPWRFVTGGDRVEVIGIGTSVPSKGTEA